MAGYYDRDHLKNFVKTTAAVNKGLTDKYLDYHRGVFADGALTAKEKQLIGLAVAHAIQCPYCIADHTRACLKYGVTKEQMLEAVFAASAVRAGATMVHGMQMLEHVDESK